MGVDPHLEQVSFSKTVQCLTGLQPEPEQDTMEKDDRYKVARSLAQSRPLARQFPWPATTTQQR
jgi:hypothetical protein